MSQDNTTLVLVAVIGLVSALLQVLRRGRRVRDDIEQDLRIIAALPSGSQARASLLASVERRVGVVAGELKVRRSYSGLLIALVLLLSSLVLLAQAVTVRGWWLLALIPAAPMFAMSFAGALTDGRKTLRDSSGRPVDRNP